MNIKELNNKLREYRDLKSFIVTKPYKLQNIYTYIDIAKRSLENCVGVSTGKIRLTEDVYKKIIESLSKAEQSLYNYKTAELESGADKILQNKLKQLEETPIDNFQIKLREVE